MDPVNQYRRNVEQMFAPLRSPLSEDSGEFEYHAEVFYQNTGRKLVTKEEADVKATRAFNRGMFCGGGLILAATVLDSLFF
jgi:hypothetical protein